MEAAVKDAYFELLRFESIGADPAHLGDCAACAAWLRRRLEAMGFDAELLLPAGERPSPDPAMNVPVVFAERLGAPGAPAVLFYGHYDVQPPDPVDEWRTPPFEPVERDGRVYCRGANDDKGQFFAFLTGLADLVAAGSPLPTVKIVLEGQEESGSAGLAAMASRVRERLCADVLCVCDTDMAPDGRPAVVAGLRGVAHFTLTLRNAAGYDLHSGTHGGVAPNPARGMCELLASLYGPDGRVAVPGFLDRVTPPTDAERKLSTTDPRAAFEPTIEVNGVHSGYGGPGSKTIIPAVAVAKLSMRLVPHQDPRECCELVFDRLRAHVPAGLSLEIGEVNTGSPGVRLAVDSPIFRLAADVLAKFDERGPAFIWEGASIPVVSVLREVSGAAPLMVGFGREEDRIHAPNESYSLEQFAQARRWAREILGALAS